MSKYLHLALAVIMGLACVWLVSDLRARLNPIPDWIPPAPVIPPNPLPPGPPRPSPLPDFLQGIEYGKVNRVSGKQLDDLIKLGVPMVAKFGAQWCGPCNTIKPHLEQFAKEVESGAEEPGKSVLVVELEITENRQPFDKFRVKSLPTLVVFYCEDEKGRIEGALTAKQIAKFVHGAVNDAG